MALASAQVVAEIAARLDGATTAADKVYTDRNWPLNFAQLPAWKVFAGDEDLTSAALKTALHEDYCLIHAEASVKATSAVDEAMNEIVAAALPALFADPIPYDLELKAVRRQPEVEGQAEIAVITLVLRAHFFFDAADPETILSSP